MLFAFRILPSRPFRSLTGGLQPRFGFGNFNSNPCRGRHYFSGIPFWLRCLPHATCHKLLSAGQNRVRVEQETLILLAFSGECHLRCRRPDGLETGLAPPDRPENYFQNIFPRGQKSKSHAGKNFPIWQKFPGAGQNVPPPAGLRLPLATLPPAPNPRRASKVGHQPSKGNE